MRFVSIVLACFASAFAVPAGAAVLRPMTARLPVAAARPMTLAATRGAFAGEVSPGESISILVRLQGQHENELAPFLASLQNPGNANPQYLTPDEFGRYFGADPLSYGRAIAALRAAGFVIDDTFENRTDITAHAPAMRVAAFFGTPIDRRFERGRLFFTARYEPQIPAALGNATISGLDDYVEFHPIGLRRPSGNVQGSWTPDDIAAGYNIAPLYAQGLDGSGVTIANSTAGAANASDVKIFQQHFGLPVVPMLSKGVGGALSPSCGRELRQRRVFARRRFRDLGRARRDVLSSSRAYAFQSQLRSELRVHRQQARDKRPRRDDQLGIVRARVQRNQEQKDRRGAHGAGGGGRAVLVLRIGR